MGASSGQRSWTCGSWFPFCLFLSQPSNICLPELVSSVASFVSLAGGLLISKEVANICGLGRGGGGMANCIGTGSMTFCCGIGKDGVVWKPVFWKLGPLLFCKLVGLNWLLLFKRFPLEYWSFGNGFSWGTVFCSKFICPCSNTLLIFGGGLKNPCP